MFENIKADMARYVQYGGWYRQLGFWITLVYRYGFWAINLNSIIFRTILRILYLFIVMPVRFFHYVHIPVRAVIGPGLLLVHPHMILFPKGVILGESCTVYHDVTLGLGPIDGVPRLADNVVVFPGARVLGGVTIGEHAHLGANTVVLRDVDPGATVMIQQRTIPSNIIKRNTEVGG